MDFVLLSVQILNGIQLGVLLFLVAAGLTLVFGILDVINLAHGALFMVGAYAGAVAAVASGSLVVTVLVAPAAALVVGVLLDRLVLRFVYERGHLEQVLATFGLLLFLNEAVRMIFGSAALPFPVPEVLDWSVTLPGGASYPAWRMAIIAAGLAVALVMFAIIAGTRAGMLVRAASTNARMLELLGIDIHRLLLGTFGIGAALAGFAGAMAGPIAAIQPGMGDHILILAFVVIVVGGTGSVQGALVGALLVGLCDTLGRAFLTDGLRLLLPPSAANEIGPAIASMFMYLVMAAILLAKPEGLLPARRPSR